MSSIDIKNFPDYACLVETNYQNTLMQKQPYIGDVFKRTRYNTIKVTVHISSDANMAKFKTWWAQELDYGVLRFAVDLPFFGNNKSYLVRMTNDLSARMVLDGAWEFVMDLEVVRAL